MNSHNLGVLKGLIQAFLAVHKGGNLAKGSTPSASTSNADIIQGLIADLSNEIITEINSVVGAPASAPSSSPAATH